jgi:hypothetical protein
MNKRENNTSKRERRHSDTRRDTHTHTHTHTSDTHTYTHTRTHAQNTHTYTHREPTENDHLPFKLARVSKMAANVSGEQKYLWYTEEQSRRNTDVSV